MGGGDSDALDSWIKFDRAVPVADESASQEQVFKDVIPIVDAVLNGVNGTVLGKWKKITMVSASEAFHKESI